jgi:FkbM family methyltransferase
MDISIYFKETEFGNFCLIENDLISNCINNYGYWEAHLHYFYSKLIKKDDIVLDGGANIGFHTIQFAKLANEGKVYAFEPQPLIFNVLSTNSLFNGLSNIIQQYRLGLSDKESTETLTSMDNPGVSMAADCINWGGRGFTEKDGEDTATTVTIDSFKLSKLNFIKLDIQGFESKALIGGKKTIEKNKPIIFIENYDGRCGDDIETKERERAPIDLLLSWGYKGYRLLMGNEDDCIFTVDDIEDIIKESNCKYEIIK